MSKMIKAISVCLALVMLTHGQIPQNAEEVQKLILVSRLGEVLKNKNQSIEELNIDTIKSILEENQDDLYGDISEFSKFATLEDLCERIEKRADRRELKATLFAVFKKLPVSQVEPKNWNEILVDGKGGSLGLITKCLLSIDDPEIKTLIVDYLIHENDLPKMKFFINRLVVLNKTNDFTAIFKDKSPKASSEEMKSLLQPSNK